MCSNSQQYIVWVKMIGQILSCANKPYISGKLIWLSDDGYILYNFVYDVYILWSKGTNVPFNSINQPFRTSFWILIDSFSV